MPTRCFGASVFVVVGASGVLVYKQHALPEAKAGPAGGRGGSAWPEPGLVGGLRAAGRRGRTARRSPGSPVKAALAGTPSVPAAERLGRSPRDAPATRDNQPFAPLRLRAAAGPARFTRMRYVFSGGGPRAFTGRVAHDLEDPVSSRLGRTFCNTTEAIFLSPFGAGQGGKAHLSGVIGTHDRGRRPAPRSTCPPASAPNLRTSGCLRHRRLAVLAPPPC